MIHMIKKNAQIQIQNLTNELEEANNMLADNEVQIQRLEAENGDNEIRWNLAAMHQNGQAANPDDNRYTCHICMANQETLVLPCGHSLCTQCLLQIQARQNQCPYCRDPRIADAIQIRQAVDN